MAQKTYISIPNDCMSTDFKALPLETLNEMLFAAVGELLEAIDKQDTIAIKAKKKQAEVLWLAISSKRKKTN